MPASRPPNIIFLQTDQHRWDALGCVNPLVRTPHLDALAARGVRFSQAVCQVPMCVPSRYSMMLGLYGSQSGLRHNTQIVPQDDLLPLPVLPQRLRDLGYQTAGFGKTHWYEGEPFFPPGAPIERSTRGFEVRAVSRGIEAEPGAATMDGSLPGDAARLKEEKRAYGGGGEDPAGYVGRTSAVPGPLQFEGWLTQRALDFLETGRDRSRPLFLYLSFNFPHPGFGVPPGYEDLYDLGRIPDRPAPPWQEEPAGHVPPPARWRGHWEGMSAEERRRTTLRYWALCTFCDDLFGQLLARLAETGELDGSLVVFASDHGEMLGDRGHRFSKYCLYEGSVRVPLILSGSRVPEILRGTVDDRPAELVDIVPTVIGATGGEIPHFLPGLDLLGGARRAGSFAEMHGMGYEAEQEGPAWMWRAGGWKLILYAPGRLSALARAPAELRGELYDLERDPGEWVNLWDDSACRSVRGEMKAALLSRIAFASAAYPRHIEGHGWVMPGR